MPGKLRLWRLTERSKTTLIKAALVFFIALHYKARSCVELTINEKAVVT